MFQGFNDPARVAVVDAQVFAVELDHDYVGVEHLLLGLLAGPSAASRVCGSLGLELTEAKARVGNLVGRRPHSPQASLAVDRRVGDVLGGARVEAARRRHRQITALHLGVAMCAHLADDRVWRGLGRWGGDLPEPRPPDSVAQHVLEAARVGVDGLHAALARVLDVAVDQGLLEVAGR